MKTKRQEELVNAYLSQFGDEIKPLYSDIILFLSELGYYPKKAGSSLSFVNAIHNKQIVKIGTRIKKNQAPLPIFLLRFSACKDYSEKFADIVSSAIIKHTKNNTYRLARCITNECDLCKGETESHIYMHTFPDGEIKTSCGVYAIEVPSITADDVIEIKKLIKEQHEYLAEHEVNVY